MSQEIKKPVTTREKDGKEQPTSDLAEAVTASEVTEAVQKQRKVDLHEQLLFMDPIREAGTSCVPIIGFRRLRHNQRVLLHILGRVTINLCAVDYATHRDWQTVHLAARLPLVWFTGK